MDFSLTREQTDLRDAVRDFMHNVAGDGTLIELQTAPTGYVPDIWRQLGRAGWFGLTIPEEYGGAGAQVGDACVVLEQFGTGPLPFLYAVQAAVSPMLIEEVADEQQRATLLPALADGTERITAALSEPDFGWSRDQVTTTLTPKDGVFVLEGTKAFVPDVAGATRVLTVARLAGTDRIILVVLDPTVTGVSHEPIEGFVSWQSVLHLDGAVVTEADVLGSVDADAWPGIERAALRMIPLVNSYQVGSCQSVFEMSLRHTRTRRQFGQPIGRFQRVQDHLIELVNYLDAARWTNYEAIWKVDTGQPAEAGLHLARSVVADAHFEACNYAHEIHAGLGADMQYGLAKHTYTSRSLYHFLGDPRTHRDLMTRALDW